MCLIALPSLGVLLVEIQVNEGGFALPSITFGVSKFLGGRVKKKKEATFSNSDYEGI